jgi:hypothetical protein
VSQRRPEREEGVTEVTPSHGRERATAVRAGEEVTATPRGLGPVVSLREPPTDTPPDADIRRLKGCRLPDAILHGKRSHRPRSRAVQRVAAAGFRVRLFSLLRLVVAPPARKPGQDTSAILSARLDRLAQGQPPLLAARSPQATGLASSLSGRLWLTVQRHRF